MRRFWHWYGENERNLGEAHLETVAKKKLGGDILSARFHIGNSGSETPFDGHLIIFGIGFYWGFSFFRKFANWATCCSGYLYDSRDWSLRISWPRLYWEFANHSDMCNKDRPKRRGPKRKRRHRTWRRGSISLSLAELIWGPKRYTYETIDSFATTIKMPEGEYAVVIDLQKQYFGRNKVPLHKQEWKWCLDVDAPKGIPTHVDHSGGWKGDRTYGFGVDFAYPSSFGWQLDAEMAVASWVLKERARTGFRKPDPIEV